MFEKKLGFGCMRLPMKEGEVDIALFTRMVDAFMQAGFNYFDTAHGYMDGKSETALRAALTSRYPRDSYIFTNKLSGHFFQTADEIPALFQSQLEASGVEYFDYYLMHAQNAREYAKYQRLGVYELMQQMKAQGKFRHLGISFHDTAQVLDTILTDHPEIEVVQLQLNYVDFDDPAVQSGKCLDVCRKHGKPVLVMEPVKGGSLVQLPAPALEQLRTVGNGSPASYAIRYAAGFEGVEMVLSGMSDMAQMEDNLSYMKDFVPLSEAEHAAVKRVCESFRAMDLIACTACRYCVDGCPAHIAIPDLFACMNAKKQFDNWNSDFYYHVHTAEHGKASDCVKCGKCELICPQHLPIRQLLCDVAATFDS